MPNRDSLQDGDMIDWNSPAGIFARQQLKVSEVPTGRAGWDALKKMTANRFRRLLVALPWLVFVTYS
jgi:hypothetical protein